MNEKGVRPLVFFNEVKTELTKVSWPTRQEAIRLTSIVVGISIVVAVFIAGIDFVFTKMMEYLISR